VKSRPVAVLDACVLVPMPLADTLLRLADRPHFMNRAGPTKSWQR
jgi:hypothetical protein